MSHAWEALFFSGLMWLLCHCYNALGCCCASDMIFFPSIAVTSIITGSSMDVQLCHMSCLKSTVFDNQLLWCVLWDIVGVLKPCRCILFIVAFWVPCIVTYVRMFVVMSMALIFSLMTAISLSLFCEWFWLYSQSSMYRFSPSLYIFSILFWWIPRRMHCSHWNSITTSFLDIATSGS